MSEKNISARITASYQLMGDPEGAPWIDLVLDSARENFTIENYKVLASETGIWGIKYILFQVDMMFSADTTHAQVKELAEPVLCDIVGDSDIVVLWVSATPTPEVSNSL